MKHLIGLLLAVVLLPLAKVHAQPALWTMKVNVPFEFNVGNRTVPAGEYRLVQSLQHFLELRDARGHLIATAFTRGIESSSAPATSQLRFIVTGSQHVLDEVWLQGNQLGEQLYESQPGDSAVAEGVASRGAAEGSRP